MMMWRTPLSLSRTICCLISLIVCCCLIKISVLLPPHPVCHPNLAVYIQIAFYYVHTLVVVASRYKFGNFACAALENMLIASRRPQTPFDIKL